MSTRAEVYAAIDSEREYQCRRWGDGGKDHEIASWITYMRRYLDQAAEIASTTYPETGALDAIRKLTAMGVSCMEEHGAPHRES